MMYKYIIVDDEPLTRRGTIKKIGDLDGLVTCVGQASDGREALTLINELDPDIIIADMNMPVMDGVDLLRKLKKDYSEKQIIVISGHKDFEYAQEAIAAKAINYILKPFGRDEIQNALKNAVELISNKRDAMDKFISIEAAREVSHYEYDIQTLQNVILGYNRSETINLTSSRLITHVKNCQYYLMILHGASDIQPLFTQSFIQNSNWADSVHFIRHTSNNNIGFVLFFFQPGTPFEPTETCQEIAEHFIVSAKQASLNITIGISSSKTELQQLPEAFQECVSALDQKKSTDPRNVYLFKLASKLEDAFDWTRKDELLYRIETGETEKVYGLIEELFLQMNSEKCSLSEIKEYCLELIQDTRVMLSYYIRNASQTGLSNSIEGILNTLFDINELREYLNRLFGNITAKMQKQEAYTGSDSVEKIKAYIQRNYMKNLSLELISTLFYLNPSYFSYIFKEKAGCNFIDYVNTVRIEHAKKLLLTSDKKLYQIAKSVGFDNVKYFFRVFKKIAKTTPEAFKLNAK